MEGASFFCPLLRGIQRCFLSLILAHIKRFFIHKYLQRYKEMIDCGEKKLAVAEAALVMPDTVRLPMTEVIVKVSDCARHGRGCADLRVGQCW